MNNHNGYYGYIPSPLHALCAHLAGDAYHDTKFSQQQAEQVFTSLYPKLPTFRDQNQQKMLNAIRMWRNQLSILDNSCNSNLINTNYYASLDNNQLRYNNTPSGSIFLLLDLVPASKSFKKIFQWFYSTPKTQISIECLKGQNWLNVLKNDTRNNYTSNAQDYLQRYTFRQLATQEQKDFLAKILKISNSQG
ncbi:hypothetical protein [Helicobacter felis]|uniref:hypothetical protein n=1 Tax=Helicobacter felis TaxID=214 RepID=UPI000CF022B3|nr:hypothetical protein [Helicobacter felis]